MDNLWADARRPERLGLTNAMAGRNKHPAKLIPSWHPVGQFRLRRFRLAGSAGGSGWRFRLAVPAGGFGWRFRLACSAGGFGWRASAADGRRGGWRHRRGGVRLAGSNGHAAGRQTDTQADGGTPRRGCLRVGWLGDTDGRRGTGDTDAGVYGWRVRLACTGGVYGWRFRLAGGGVCGRLRGGGGIQRAGGSGGALPLAAKAALLRRLA